MNWNVLVDPLPSPISSSTSYVTPTTHNWNEENLIEIIFQFGRRCLRLTFKHHKRLKDYINCQFQYLMVHLMRFGPEVSNLMEISFLLSLLFDRTVNENMVNFDELSVKWIRVFDQWRLSVSLREPRLHSVNRTQHAVHFIAMWIVEAKWKKKHTHSHTRQNERWNLCGTSRPQTQFIRDVSAHSNPSISAKWIQFCETAFGKCRSILASLNYESLLNSIFANYTNGTHDAYALFVRITNERNKRAVNKWLMYTR